MVGLGLFDTPLQIWNQKSDFPRCMLNRDPFRLFGSLPLLRLLSPHFLFIFAPLLRAMFQPRHAQALCCQVLIKFWRRWGEKSGQTQKNILLFLRRRPLSALEWGLSLRFFSILFDRSHLHMCCKCCVHFKWRKTNYYVVKCIEKLEKSKVEPFGFLSFPTFFSSLFCILFEYFCIFIEKTHTSSG